MFYFLGIAISAVPALAFLAFWTRGEGEPSQQQPKQTTEGRPTLLALRPGQRAVIDDVAQDCAGLARRRLLDLGFVPGSVVSVAMENPLGSPRAYSIRGATIALRNDLARQIHIRPAA